MHLFWDVLSLVDLGGLNVIPVPSSHVLIHTGFRGIDESHGDGDVFLC
jgi:hypothetical protein